MSFSGPSVIRLLKSSRLLVIAGCTLVVLVYVLRLDRVAGMYVDDAWYVLLAQALAAGQGYHLVSAPTTELARILPASPPGFAIVLSLIAKLLGAFPGNVIGLKLVSVAAMFGVGLLAALYYRDRGVPAPMATLLAVVVVLTPAFVWLATSTVMSEPLFTLAQLGAIVLVMRRRPVSAGFIAAMAALVRSAGLPVVGAIALWYLVRRDWRGVRLFVVPVALVLVPWMVYARTYATPLDARLQHGGAHIFTYSEQFWMRRAGEIQSGRITWSDVPARVGSAVVDILGRDVGATVLPELYRMPTESGEETMSVGGKRSDLGTGSMGNTTGTMLVSGLLSVVALAGFIARWRRGGDVSDLVVPLALVPIVLFPHWAYRLVLPLTPFLFGYLVAGVQAITSAWARVLRIALVCVLALHVLDHAQYRLRMEDALWIQDAREADQLLTWMRENLRRPGAVASSNPALVYLRTGRRGVAIDSARERWGSWRAMGVRYLVSLDGGQELPEARLPYRVLFKTPRSGMWVVEVTD